MQVVGLLDGPDHLLHLLSRQKGRSAAARTRTRTRSGG